MNGEVALDRLSDIVALANALQIAPSELMRLPLPAPANGHTDSIMDEVRLALMAVNHHRPGGQVLPIEVARERVATLIDASSAGDQALAGGLLPDLIRDLHTSVAAGRDVAELLELVTLLHTQATIGWLRTAGASVDLREQAAALARGAAAHSGEPGLRGSELTEAHRVHLVPAERELLTAAD